MNGYYLPPHVYFCYRGRSLVFLDLLRDDYTLVDGDNALALRNILHAQPDASDASNSKALADFIANGLLTTDSSIGKPILPTKLEVALEPLVDPEITPKIQITMNHLFRFVVSCASAAFQLRFRSIDDTVTAVKRRKEKFGEFNCASCDRARELTTVFLRIRAFFPRNYLCLYDSLALIEFLARYQIFPNWVFGITLEPWLAHCWVQGGMFIFNEDVETAAGYTPVMVV